MKQSLQEIRSLLELQHAIQGNLLPLGLPGSPVESETPVQIKSIEPAAETAPTHTESLPDDMTEKDLFGNDLEPANESTRSPYERIASLIPEDSPLHAMQTLEEVSDYVSNTVLIPLDETRIKPVFGVGNPKSDLLVIGEAPGADEDKKGEPFVGRAGQLLDKILAAINFERESIYIANILKSRPPNNRDPKPEEIAAHLPLLHKQITLIQPKIILCVGKTAGNNLLGKSGSLSSMRGKTQDFHGLPVVVTYHPAALLRNPQWKRPTWEDVQFLRARFDELVGVS